ncbi:MAG TPA: tetratricopeptide repeat protein, partial [Rhizomicrobium sp.]|nr:tetratricopeptide repeat protein [Rhizomicrobium sp.]
QARFAEAAALLSQSRMTSPQDPVLACNLGRALMGAGRIAQALEAFQAAIKLKPDFVEARYDAARLLHRTGQLAEAERDFRDLLRIMPGNAHISLALGGLLVDAGQPGEAEAVLRQSLGETADPRYRAQLLLSLSLALRRQRKDEEALAACDMSEVLDPALPGIALQRADALQNLERHEEALAILKDQVARAPEDPRIQHAYNDLLYRLGRREEFLRSYDQAPSSRTLQLGKAFFLAHEKRYAEVHELYAGMLARDPDDEMAAIGVATALSLLKRYSEADKAFDALLARRGGRADLLRRAAEAAVQCGDPQKAARHCENALRLSPRDGSSLAVLSVASRMLGDGRDDAINRYDTLVQAFDLEAPEGFSSMADFNAELDAALGRLHPQTREFVGQSLRGGTQTPDNLFGAGLELVEKLKVRIDEAMARYIAALPEDAAHPFLSRRRQDFRYSGSWSSRLRDSGFHVNHLHPMGWISSCYYVAVPGAVKDETAQQGWIKFGEPSFQAALKTPVRRTIQPAAGRLVLFPSYMWHGTIPFHDTAARTTIAFDVVPKD